MILYWLKLFFFQALSLLGVTTLPSILLKCRHLTLRTDVTIWEHYGIANLLQILPYLETLDIDMRVLPRCSFSDNCPSFLSHIHSFIGKSLIGILVTTIFVISSIWIILTCFCLSGNWCPLFPVSGCEFFGCIYMPKALFDSFFFRWRWQS